MYIITKNYFILSDGIIPSWYKSFVVHDAPDQALYRLFMETHRSFKKRVRDLGDVTIASTPHDQEALRIILDTLIQAKEVLYQEDEA